jgi:hypothetical protein
MPLESMQPRVASGLKRAEEAGFAARSAGRPRDANPHAVAVTLPYVDLSGPEHRTAWAQAWWRGWDRADADLA